MDNTQLPSARTISNALSAGSDRADTDNTVLVMQVTTRKNIIKGGCRSQFQLELSSSFRWANLLTTTSPTLQIMGSSVAGEMEHSQRKCLPHMEIFEPQLQVTDIYLQEL